MVKRGLAACALLGLTYLACSSSPPAAANSNAAAGTSAAGESASGAGGSVAGAVNVGGAITSGGAGAALTAGQGGLTSGGSGGTIGGGGASGNANDAGPASPLPAKTEVLATLKKVNDAWMAGHTDPGDNMWARSVYFIGDTEFAKISGRDAETTYATKWATNHQYGLNDGTGTTSADDQCAGQAYLALNEQAAAPNKIAAIQSSLSNMVKNGPNNAWWWIDALFMAMPSFVKLGVLNDDPKYFNSAWLLYQDAKRAEGSTGLYSDADALWWRDKSYKPPHAEPNGKSTFWSRGNGWVFAAHARVLLSLPQTDAHRAEYLSTFQAMAVALQKVQRSDGFWNVSLADPMNFPGPETSGTALYVYGYAVGIAQGWLDRETYEPIVNQAYRALVTTAVHADGTVGYIQGVGADPTSSQPVTANSNADFGVGAFLLAGSAVYALTPN